MELIGINVKHLNTVTHDNKVIVFGTDETGAVCYTVRRSGFETSLDQALGETVRTGDPTGFEDWKPLPLGKAQADPSVIAEEKKTLTYIEDDKEKPILRSVYEVPDTKSADAPVQLISAFEHLYVFRQSPEGKIRVNRFVLNGHANELIPKYEVRHQRSGQRLRPDSTMGIVGGELNNTDSRSYKGIDNNAFYEPATELSFIPPTENGWFAVTLVPTQKPKQHRWHIFAYDPGSDKIILHSVRASKAGLFDATDYLFTLPGAKKKTVFPLAGIIQRTIDLKELQIAQGPGATTYDLQHEQETKQGLQLMRGATRLMLALPVKEKNSEIIKTAAIAFSVAMDGTLSQVDLFPDTSERLQSNVREVLLPLNTLDEIKEITDSTPVPNGTITGMERGQFDQANIRSNQIKKDTLKLGDEVKITNTQHYNGMYEVKAIEDGNFLIDASFTYDEPGFWEVIPPKETGMLFDNMIVGYEKTPDGKLKIQCPGHELQPGDQVQITGTANQDGTYDIKSIANDSSSFTLNAPFVTGEAVNLRSIRRRGMRFDGTGDYLETPLLELTPPQYNTPFSRTVSGWIRMDSQGELEQQVIHDASGLLSLVVTDTNQIEFRMLFSDNTIHTIIDSQTLSSDLPVTSPDKVDATQWVHYAGAFDYKPEEGGKTHLTLLRNGQAVIPVADRPNEIVENSQKIVQYDTPSHIGKELYQFDGNTGYLEVPTMNPDYSQGFTLEGWFYFDEIRGARILDFADAGNGFTNNILIYTNNNTCRFQVLKSGDVSRFLDAPNTLQTSQWIHFAGVIEPNGEARIYFNGQQQGSGLLFLPANVERTKNVIGKSNNQLAIEPLFKGHMSEIRMWNTARSEQQIQDNMYRILAGTEPNLVGYWPLNGQPDDLSPTKDHALVQGGLLTEVASYRYPIYKVKKYLKFDGVDDHVQVPFTNAAGAVSLSLWAKSDTERWSATGCMVSKRNAFIMSPVQNSKDIWFFIFSGKWYKVAFTLDFDIQQWHHYTGTYDGQTMKLYVDGEEVGSRNISGSVSVSNNPLYIGMDDVSPRKYFDGSMAEVRLYDRAQDQQEIQADMYDQLAGYENSLVGYWPLAEDTKDHSVDAAAWHGTPVGDPVFLVNTHHIGGDEFDDTNFVGELAEVRIWDRARTEEEIQHDMPLLLTGKEEDLAAYYRLGATFEQSPDNTVVSDFSIHEKHAIVHGDPYVGARSLYRTTRSGKKVFKYANDALFAVTQHATYEESFEFQVRYRKDAVESGNSPLSPLHVSTVPPVTDGLFFYATGESLESNTWKDLSANGRHIYLPADPALKPGNIEIANYNGKSFDVARITPDQEIHLPDAVNVQGPCTIFLVDCYNGLVSPGKLITIKGSTLQSRDRNDWNLGKYSAFNACRMGNWAGTWQPAAEGVFTINTATLDAGGKAYWYLDGIQKGTVSGAVAPGKLSLGSTLEPSNADIGCLLIYDRVLLQEERTQVEWWLSQRYGVQGSFEVPLPLPLPLPESEEPASDAQHIDVNNADGRGNPLFRFAYRGKSSRYSTEWKNISEEYITQSDFEDLGDGWYRALSRFIVPQDIHLMRNFEINQVKGKWTDQFFPPEDEWQAIDIRKHRIRFVSDSITREQYTDEITLETLRIDQGTSEDQLEQIRQLEEEMAETEGALLQENANDPSAKLVELEGLISNKQAEVNNLKQQIQEAQAKETVEQVQAKIDAAVAENAVLQQERNTILSSTNPLDYCHRFWGKQSSKLMTTQGDKIVIYPEDANQEQKFELSLGADTPDPVNDQLKAEQYYHLKTTDSQRYVFLNKAATRELALQETLGGDDFNWKINSFQDFNTLHSGDPDDIILNGHVLVELAAINDGAKVISFLGTFASNDNNQWKVEKTTTLIKSKRDRLAEIEAAIAANLANIATWQQKILALQNGTPVDIGQLQAQLAEAQAALEAFQKEYDALKATDTQGQTEELQAALKKALKKFNKLNTAFLKGLAEADPLKMPLIKKDRKALRTHGALLDFVRPYGGVNATETSQGMVQLSYFDRQGCMRLTPYDAVSDSRNSTFEQWLPDRLRACVVCRESGDKISLNQAISLPSEAWSLEAWHYFPTPLQTDGTPYTYNQLTASTQDGTAPLVIHQGSRLGALVNGGFQDSGIDLLTALTPGWYHLAVVFQKSVGMVFYLDGKPTGNTIPFTIAPQNITVIGNAIDGGSPAGKLVEVRFWDIALTPKEIEANAYTLLTGYEPGLIAYWPLDEAEGTEARDHTENHIHGTLSGADWMACTASIGALESQTVIEQPVQVMQFDGVDDYIEVPYREVFSTQTFTVSCWVKVTGGAGTYRSPITFRDTFPSSGFLIYANTQNKWQLSLGATNWVSIAGPSVEMDVWTYVTATYDSQKMYLYINGKQVGNGEDVTMVLNSTKPLRIGAGVTESNTPQYYFPGLIAEVRFYNLARSLEDIQGDMYSPLTGSELGLTGYWPLLNGQVADLAPGSPHNGIANGNPAWQEDLPVFSTPLPFHTYTQFNGLDTYVEIQAFTNLTEAVTISCWAKSDTPIWNSHGSMVSKRDAFVMHPLAGSKLIRFYIHSGGWRSVDFTPPEIQHWHHYAGTFDGKKLCIYMDGILQKEVAFAGVITADDGIMAIGWDEGLPDRYFWGRIAHVSLWSAARNQAQIQQDMGQNFTGQEAGLEGYWPLLDGDTSDLSSHARHGTLLPAKVSKSKSDHLITTEYSTVKTNADGSKEAILRQFLGYVSGGTANLLPDKRIEQLVYQWVGTTQFKPSLVGYIEGAPPVPSENLTVQQDYDGAVTVSLNRSKNLEYRWDRSENVAHGNNTLLFAGSEGELFKSPPIIGGVIDKTGAFRIGVSSSANMRDHSEKGSSKSSSSSLNETDTLQLKGDVETERKFLRLGTRYLPKNTGYALVASGKADMFITKLARSHRMVSYELKSVEQDVKYNVITFMINPAHTLNGSLDGMVGSHEADKTFYDQIAEMRAQYGSLYPGSYYRPAEAKRLKDRIDDLHTMRASYFHNYDLSFGGSNGAFDASQLNDSKYDEYYKLIEQAEEEVKQAEKDLEQANKELSQAMPFTPDWWKALKKIDDAKKSKAQAEYQISILENMLEIAMKEGLKEDRKEKKAQLKSAINDLKAQKMSLDGLEEWQTQLEALFTESGARNMMNTYVWDADGGMRTEEQGFVDIFQHSFGNENYWGGEAGGDSSVLVEKAKFELRSVYAGEMFRTYKKEYGEENALAVTVDLAGLENKNITDLQDSPVLPGEKVSRYRFSTFYLEGEEEHFNDFFNEVVDPEWLESNREDAIFLRKLRGKTPNSPWRIRHIVTDVERPVLAGSSTGTTQGESDSKAAEAVIDYVDDMENKQKELEVKIDRILALLKKK